MNDRTPLLKPFAGLRPAAGREQAVLAPPYDVVTAAEARERAEGKPWSFLRVSRPEIDFPVGENPSADALYAKASDTLQRMIAEGVLVRDPGPRIYVYRITAGDHVQTGIVGAASVDAYARNQIRRHELTRPDKEDDRVRQIEGVNAHTGPVMVAHRPDRAVDEIVNSEVQRAPDLAAIADDGAEHALWILSDPHSVDSLSGVFRRMDALYMADGHHRANAATRVAQARRAANSTPSGNESYESFLAVVFPSDQLRILDYNRVVRDLGELTPGDFLGRIEEAFEVVPAKGSVRPSQRGRFGMYLDGRWYDLRLRDPAGDADSVVDRLDISLLTARLLAPILGVGDPRSDPRIDFVGGARGMGELERRVDSGEMAVAFSVFPTTMKDLIAVSDAGAVMPPKSTWFEPKLADGLVTLVLD